MRAFPANRTFWRRVGAGLVDVAVFAPLMWANAALWERLPGATSRVAWFVIYGAVATAYSVVMHARYGQTLGKMLTRVKVVATDGGPICWSHAVRRDCVPLMSLVLTIATKWSMAASGLNPFSVEAANLTTPFDDLVSAGSQYWMYLEFATMWSNAKRRAVHDFLAGTMVVRIDMAPQSAA